MTLVKKLRKGCTQWRCIDRDVMCREAADRIEELEGALREIAAEACVSLDDLPPHDYPNGWRYVAVARIDIARQFFPIDTPRG